MKALPMQIDITDGRVFGLRDIGPGDMLDLIEAAGSAASSDTWMRYAVMICSVQAIDGKPIMMPSTKNAIRELGRKIGNVGMEALAAVLYPEQDPEQENLSGLDAIKN